jgi:hypothetical protein
VSYLELLRLPYTGCNPRGLILARDKALSKKLLAYHRIPVPEFTAVRVGHKPVLSKRLRFPLIVKSLFFESSVGISQASVVENTEQLVRRVQFIHDSLKTAAIVEQFVDGRELYVGVLGNERLEVLPVWEMSFAQMPENRWRIATERVKWSTQYQKKHGIMTDRAVVDATQLGPHPADCQAGVPRPRSQRLRPHRPAHGRRGHGLCARGQPQSQPRVRRGLRRISRGGRHLVRATSERIATLGMRWEPARTG